MGRNVIYHFKVLTDIPDSIYYRKFFKINIDGYWQADNVREAFGFDERLIKYPVESCKYLSKFTDREIKSVFKFIFDGPHPKNKFNKELYNKLNSIIGNQNKRLAALLTQAYNEVMAKDDGHGH